MVAVPVAIPWQLASVEADVAVIAAGSPMVTEPVAAAQPLTSVTL